MKKTLFFLVLCLSLVSTLVAEGGTLYLYRTKSLPVQKYPVVANQQPIGAIDREQTLVIHTSSDYVLLYLHNALGTVPRGYMVYRYFVNDGDTYVEIDGDDFRIVESEGEKTMIRENASIAEVRVP